MGTILQDKSDLNAKLMQGCEETLILYILKRQDDRNMLPKHIEPDRFNSFLDAAEKLFPKIPNPLGDAIEDKILSLLRTSSATGVIDENSLAGKVINLFATIVLMPTEILFNLDSDGNTQLSRAWGQDAGLYKISKLVRESRDMEMDARSEARFPDPSSAVSQAAAQDASRNNPFRGQVMDATRSL